jgi:hypothetical protein
MYGNFAGWGLNQATGGAVLQHQANAFNRNAQGFQYAVKDIPKHVIEPWRTNAMRAYNAGDGRAYARSTMTASSTIVGVGAAGVSLGAGSVNLARGIRNGYRSMVPDLSTATFTYAPDLNVAYSSARVGSGSPMWVNSGVVDKVLPTSFANIFPNHEIGTPNLIPLDKLSMLSPRFNYVVMEDGNLIVGKRFDGPGGGHIDLASGQNVAAAGEFQVVNGKMKYIDNSSGHYLPYGSSAQVAAERAFRNLGFDINGVYKEKAWVPDPSLPRGGSWKPVK